ncbi:MAG: hypothetical protein ACFBWO_05425 [Paracoccaceae bacterium]
MPVPIDFDVLGTYVTAGDRVGYYSQLAQWGYRYGDLAAPVVTGATPGGRAANAFLLDGAADEGVALSPDQVAGISDQLMRADFAARQAFAGSRAGLDLPVDAIQAYHETVFGRFGVSADAWTPNFALEALPTAAARDAYWDLLLAATDPVAAAEILVAPVLPATSPAAIDWLTDVLTAGAVAAETGSNAFGGYDIDVPGGVRVIGDAVGGTTLDGTGGPDVILGFDGDDTLNGGAGDDRLYGGGGADLMRGGAGDDLLYGTDDDGLILVDGLDVFPDVLDGQSGADTHVLGAGDHAADSGTDGALDVYVFEGGTRFADADGAYDGPGAIRSFGLPEPSDAPAPAPTLSDAVRAGAIAYGFDLDGDRLLSVPDDGRVLIEVDANWGDGGFDLDVGREEEAVRGDERADRIVGSLAGDDLLLGLDGDDRLVGLGGEDEISGGSGDDRLFGGVGDDDLYGDRGGDALAGGFGDDRLWGGSGDDRVGGGFGDDLLSGGLGDDRLFGGFGDDVLRGDGGGDLLDGGPGTDTAIYEGSAEGVVIALADGPRPGVGEGGDAEGDRLRSVENVVGSAFDDAIAGNGRDNEIAGGAGDDALSGGGGDDLFVYASGDGADTIADFTVSAARGFPFLGHADANDRVRLEVDGLAAFGDLSIADGGGGAILAFGDGGSLTFQGVRAEALTAEDFLFA